MQSPYSHAVSERTLGSSLQSALLYMLATGALILMLLALEPTLALPLTAFLAMATLTCRLGLRVFGDLSRATGRNNRITPLFPGNS